jgi:AcrR family transcriptional regulator
MLRSEHVEATRRAVLAAARSLFGRKGYTQTSIDEIAAAARVTKGAVYHHFAGKKALFRAVYAEVARLVLGRRHQPVTPLRVSGLMKPNR